MDRKELPRAGYARLPCHTGVMSYVWGLAWALANMTVVGCSTKLSETPSPVPARRVGTPQAANTPTKGRSEATPSVVDNRADEASNSNTPQKPRVEIFEHNGFRITYTHRTASHPIGLIVIGSAEKLWRARRLARKASAALGLPYAEYEYKPDFGFTESRDGCTERGYPCAPRWRNVRKPFAYVRIEQDHYERWRSGEFVVIAAHGPPGSDLLRETLIKAKAAFPEAYEETTREVWIESSATKIVDDVPPATERATQFDSPAKPGESDRDGKP